MAIPMTRVLSWSAVAAALALFGGVLAHATLTRDPGARVPLQALLNQGFEVKAAGASGSGTQTLYLQKTSLLYACPLDSGLDCGRIVSR